MSVGTLDFHWQAELRATGATPLPLHCVLGGTSVLMILKEIQLQVKTSSKNQSLGVANSDLQMLGRN